MFLSAELLDDIHLVWGEMNKIYPGFITFDDFCLHTKYFHKCKVGGIAFLALPYDDSKWVINAYCPKSLPEKEVLHDIASVCRGMGCKTLICNTSCDHIREVLLLMGFHSLPGYKGNWFERAC